MAPLFVLALGCCSAIALPNYALAQDPCDTAAGQNSDYCKAQQDNPVVDTIGKVSKLLALVGGIAAVLWIIFSGIKFATSDGDPQKAASARSGIIYATIGVIVIVVAQAVILFVLSKIKI